MSLKNVNHQKRSFTWSMEKPSAKDYFLTVFIFVVCTLIGLLFQKLNFTDTNIVTIYILGILLTSIVTDGYLCSVAGSFLSVFLFCFFLTEPRMSFKTYAVGYPVTFFIMLISSVLTGALAAKLKTHAKLSTQLAFRTQILFDTDRLLQKAKGETEILDVTCTQLLRLLNRNITAYVVENGTLSEGKLFSGEKEDTEDFLIPEEQQIARWVCENRQHAGASTHHFPQAKCLYLAIRSGDNVYGVIGIPLQKETLDTFEYSILLSVINECALAMENAKNALEKEKNAVIAKNEQLRADLLRAISHDLRTPLCSISGNADMLLGIGVEEGAGQDRIETLCNAGYFIPDFGGVDLAAVMTDSMNRVYSALEIQVMDAGEEYTLIHDASVPAAMTFYYTKRAATGRPETEYDMNRKLINALTDMYKQVLSTYFTSE